MAGLHYKRVMIFHKIIAHLQIFLCVSVMFKGMWSSLSPKSFLMCFCNVVQPQNFWFNFLFSWNLPNCIFMFYIFGSICTQSSSYSSIFSVFIKFSPFSYPLFYENIKNSIKKDTINYIMLINKLNGWWLYQVQIKVKWISHKNWTHHNIFVCLVFVWFQL